MDRENFYKKLAEISLDPPIDRNDILIKRFGAPMKKMTYRECAIEHLKTHLGCVGYRDYLIAELEKLDKIEQIVNEWNDSITESEQDFDYLCKIGEVLEK